MAGFLDYVLNYTLFFTLQHFYEQHQDEIGKNSSKTKQHPEAELLLFENFSLFSCMLSSKNDKAYSKKGTKTKVCLCKKVCLLYD